MTHKTSYDIYDNHFDRLLIAQVRVEDAILISADPAFANYPFRLFW